MFTMANTERLKTLQIVHELKMLVSEKRIQFNFEDPEIEDLFFLLDALEDKLIVADICKKSDQLIAAAEGLNDVISEGNKAINDIQDIIKLIKKAANAVKCLVKAAEIAAEIAS
jgi:Asp-tRNA(Asn)/Glu-tRNA(Gln) amidotransferase B subunit